MSDKPTLKANEGELKCPACGAVPLIETTKEKGGVLNKRGLTTGRLLTWECRGCDSTVEQVDKSTRASLDERTHKHGQDYIRKHRC